MKYYLIAIGFYCLFICSCKKKKDAPPASRLPASFTGMKEWRDADQPTSTYRYHFSVKTSGKDDVIIDSNNILSYRSTDSSKTGYTLKYQGSGNGSSVPGNGQSYASFIHTTAGDTIYYTTVYIPMGQPSAIARYVTP